jgi:hypothetical protein
LNGGRAVAVGMARFLETFSEGPEKNCLDPSGRRSLDEFAQSEKSEFLRAMKIGRIGFGR